MAVVQCVQLQGPAQVSVDELRPHIILREAVVHTEILNPRGKPLIQPQVGPPFLLVSQSSFAYCTNNENVRAEKKRLSKYSIKPFSNKQICSTF